MHKLLLDKNWDGLGGTFGKFGIWGGNEWVDRTGNVGMGNTNFETFLELQLKWKGELLDCMEVKWDWCLTFRDNLIL